MTLGISSGIALRRALFGFDPRRSEAETVDVLVIGTGIAGLSVATSLPAGLSVAVATKGRLQDGSTWSAQGGVAAPFGKDDSPRLHLADTLAAGSGLCDADAVRALVDDATDSIRFLERSGLALDLDDGVGRGGRSLAREGGHSRNRIVHAGGDATGAAIVRALAGSAAQMGVATVEESFLADLLLDQSGAIAGAVFLTRTGTRVVRCGAVVLASGGYGQLFAETTSPVTCTGDGAAAALRAGATLADLEFVQFHPTTLHVERDPRPLISEAMRGEGAVLRDGAGASVMAGLHPLGDLAPRDIVSRAMVEAMTARGTPHLFLDATGLDPQHLRARFPTIVASCRSLGIDPASEQIPVSPAAHYTMGGIRADLAGRTDVDGLFAVGEVAATGVHGANRLASNSLLEGVVFGRRVAAEIGGLPMGRNTPVPLEVCDDGRRARAEGERGWLRRTMVDRAGVVRSGDGLRNLLDEVVDRLDRPPGSTVAAYETENLFEVATGLALLASAREESRGAHYRTDYPTTRVNWMRHQLVSRGPDGTLELRRTELGVEAERRSVTPSTVAAAG